MSNKCCNRTAWFYEEMSKMGYRYNVSCSETSANEWTPTAIECYEIGCRCSECNINNIYFKGSSFSCKMKETVIELVRKYGVPQKRKGI